MCIRDRSTAQAQRQVTDAKQRQERFRPGLKGFWDRMRGEHKRIQALNMRETDQAKRRDRDEKDRLIFQQLAQRRTLVQERTRERQQADKAKIEIAADRARFEAGRLEPDKVAPKPRRERSERPKQAPDAERPSKPNVVQTFNAHADGRHDSQSSRDLTREERREAFKAKRRGEEGQEHSRAPKLDR